MLIGKKVCLGPILQADAGFIFNWHNTTEIMHLDGLYRPISQTVFDHWFNSIGSDPSRVVFAIRRQTDLAFVGYIQVLNIHPVFRTAELGIMIGDTGNRRKGYGLEALQLCIDFCWSELNLQRLSLSIIGENESAKLTYAKAGFTHEGLLRRSVYMQGDFHDTTLMALLRQPAE